MTPPRDNAERHRIIVERFTLPPIECDVSGAVHGRIKSLEAQRDKAKAAEREAHFAMLEAQRDLLEVKQDLVRAGYKIEEMQRQLGRLAMALVESPPPAPAHVAPQPAAPPHLPHPRAKPRPSGRVAIDDTSMRMMQEFLAKPTREPGEEG